MEKMRKTLALVLCLVMCLGMLPTWALAEDDTSLEEPAAEMMQEEPEAELLEQAAESEAPAEALVYEEAALEEAIVEVLPEPTEEVWPEENPDAAENTVVEEPEVPAAEDNGGAEGESAPVNAESTEPATEPDLQDPTEFTEETDTAPVEMVFVVTPEEAEVLVYTKDENDENTEIDPEEDGSYLLLPGEYYYTLTAEGYVSAEEERLQVEPSEEPFKIELTLLPVQPEESLENAEEVTLQATEETEETATLMTASGTCGANLTWTLDDEGTLTISGTGPMDDFNDPPSWGQVSQVVICPGVTSIGKYAFYWYGISKITIPETVTSIGTYAFRNCPLKTAGPIGSGCDIEFGWTSAVPEEAFAYSELESITLPEGIAALGDRAFDGCINLKDVILPNSLKSIGDGAFSSCAFTTLTIPNGVISIGYHAFYSCQNITSIVLPESVTSIGSGIFGWCTSLTSVTISGNVESMGDGVFLECDKLIDAGPIGSGCAIELGWKNAVPDGAFADCEYITAVTLPEGITIIGDHAFSQCSGLTEIAIPETVTSIGYSAFYKCSSLVEITIPDSVTSIGMYAFDSCSNLSKVSISRNITAIEEGEFMRCSMLADITIPAGVTYFGNAAFEDCTSLTEITFPETLRKIGEIAFSGCNQLETITFLGSAPYYIGEDAFQNVNATVSYPKVSSWTEGKRKNYGGTLTWIPYMQPAMQLEINAGNFPDANFRNYVQSSFDQNNDGILDRDEIAEIKIVRCNQKNIRSLKGIEHFPSLERLICFGNTLTELDVSNNPELISLNCGTITETNKILGNNLTSLDVSKNLKLQYLWCAYNQIRQLDVSRNTELLEFACYHNQLKNLDVSKNVKLQRLLPGDNPIGTIDVSNNPDLWQLNCYGNGLQTLDISNNLQLTFLWCNDNSLRTLDLTKHTALQNLNCIGNQLTSLDLSNNAALQRLECYGNALTKLDLRNCSTLADVVRNGVRRELNNTAVLYYINNGSCYVSFDQTVSIQPTIFSDNGNPDAYYHDPIYWAVDNGITVGYGGPGLFSPGAYCTREQIVTFLWNMKGKPEPKKIISFTDVEPGKWYEKPISWAAEEGITVGLNDGTGRFGVGQACTREMCVSFLHRAVGSPEPGTYTEFTDVSAERYYYKPISWAAENGITVGLNDGTGRFGVGQTCTRGMIVSFLYRFSKLA